MPVAEVKEVVQEVKEEIKEEVQEAVDEVADELIEEVLPTPEIVEETDELIPVDPSEDSDNEDEELAEGQDPLETVFEIDTTASIVNWEGGRIIPGGDHYGTVAVKSGKMVYGKMGVESGEAVLDMTTIVSEAGDKLNGHLKNEDFFDVENHPEATLVITSTDLQESPDGDVTVVTADLTIKGMTNEITFPAVEDEYGTTAEFSIDRTRWDIKYGSARFFDDLADKAIKDEIDFEVSLKYVQ